MSNKIKLDNGLAAEIHTIPDGYEHLGAFMCSIRPCKGFLPAIVCSGYSDNPEDAFEKAVNKIPAALAELEHKKVVRKQKAEQQKLADKIAQKLKGS